MTNKRDTLPPEAASVAAFTGAMTSEGVGRRETISGYLRRMGRKDRDQGGTGWRSTREVADYFGLPLRTARSRLNRLFDAGEIDSCRDGVENTLYWREAQHDRS